jgi:hypothetical protein
MRLNYPIDLTPNVEWIFHAKHGTKFETLEAAFAALGKKIEISFR